MKETPSVVDALLEKLRGAQPRTIVITGANSGIGFQAAKLFLQVNPDHRVILVCRTEQVARTAAERIRSELRIDFSVKSTLIPMACDHASLESIRNFAAKLPRILDVISPKNSEQGGIDVLCLNAAVLRGKDSPVAYTEDGLELTFQTNALAPFAIAHMTMDLMNPGGRVVVSTSGLYAHTNLCMAGLTEESSRRKAKKGFEMLDGSKFHFKQSYALSKVCNVALTISLQHRLASRNVTVNCFSPGLMTSSGLFRHQTAHDMENALKHSKFVRDNEKSVEWGGGALAFMALADEAGTVNGMYWSDTDSRKGDRAQYGIDFTAAPISQDAVPLDRTEDLWYLFCQLAGMPPYPILN